MTHIRMTEKRKIGQAGEDAVCAVLEKRGHTILARNWRKPFGEIDIVSQSGDYIVFTEVKARKRGSMVSGASAVDAKKQRKIILCADAYLTENPTQLQPRYDVAEVTTSRGVPTVVESVFIIEDAFTADGIYTVN